MLVFMSCRYRLIIQMEAEQYQIRPSLPVPPSVRAQKRFFFQRFSSSALLARAYAAQMLHWREGTRMRPALPSRVLYMQKMLMLKSCSCEAEQLSKAALSRQRRHAARGQPPYSRE